MIALLSATANADLSARSVSIVVGRDTGTTLKAVATRLRDRITERSAVLVDISPRATGADLTLYLGRIGTDRRFDKLCNDHEVTLPGGDTPAPESYALKRDDDTLIGLAADDRALMYVAGEVLRQLRYEPDSVTIGDVDFSTAPAYRFRGFSQNQGGSMRKVTEARAWTQAEVERGIDEYAFAGANCFYAGHRGGATYDFVKSMAMMTCTDARPNIFREDFPEAWAASGLDDWEGDHWVCPSVPEARAALMEKWEKEFAKRPYHDIMRMYAGDPGGCRDERCAPWGKTFVHLCEDVARLWNARYPDSVVMIANQDVTNVGDQAIFDYLSAEPRPWLYALAYGPGSNAMSRYFRDELRDDLFVYPGHGWTNRYLAETLNQLPKEQRIVHYSDITHWISAQYMVENPEPNIMKSYGRRTFHARPKAFYRIFQQIMPFSEGDIIYSEGYHDEFHQYLWARLLWNPNRALDDLVREYCVLQFGEDAAPLMANALYQLEANIEQPLETNEGIDRYYLLVREAGWRIPPQLMLNNWRWRIHMQKAELDKYNQLKLHIERDKEERIAALLAQAIKKGAVDSAVAAAIAVLAESTETDEMKTLRESAGRHGDESEALYGVRNIGYPKITQTLRPLERLGRALDRAQNADTRRTKRKEIEEALRIIDLPTQPGRIFW
jgi:hypothetical protein